MAPRKCPGLLLKLVLIGVVALALGTSAQLEESSHQPSSHGWFGLSASCLTDEDGNATSTSCQGVRMVRRIVQRMIEDAARRRDIELVQGVNLVRSSDDSDGQDEPGRRSGRFLRGFTGSLLGFLGERELRIRLPSLLPANYEEAIRGGLAETGRGKGGGGGFGGGKKDGGVLMMALMMGKMMAAMGFGALGLLAMKALMISALALMLSLIVAAKKLAGGKEESGGHHIVYAQEVGHHRRRRRSAAGPAGAMILPGNPEDLDPQLRFYPHKLRELYQADLAGLEASR